MSVGALERVKYQNLRRVVQALRASSGLTRRQIAGRTGLSVPTVNRNVNELLERGAVTMFDAKPSGQERPGRPAGLTALNPDYGLLVGADIGEHTVRVAVADFTGRVLDSAQLLTEAHEGGSHTLDNVITAIRELLAGQREAAPASNGTPPSDGRHLLRALTVGVPGTVDQASGTVLDAPNIAGWRDFPLGSLLQEQFPGVTCRLENDVNTAAVGEAAYGRGPEQGDFVFVSFRRGIGAGIIHGGELFRGATGKAGEVGFMAFDAGFSYEDANGLGHLETLAGEPRLLQLAEEAGFDFARNGGGGPSFSLRCLAHAAVEGDPVAKEVLNRALRFYGIAVANIVSLLDPELIVLGGDLTVVGEQGVEEIGRVLERLIPHAPRLTTSSLDEDAFLRGAVYQAHVDACEQLSVEEG